MLTSIVVLVLTVLSVGNGAVQSEDQRNFLFKQCNEYALGLHHRGIAAGQRRLTSDVGRRNRKEGT